jgi:pimeloyl-ACP methyl ester carboxylesterase
MGILEKEKVLRVDLNGQSVYFETCGTAGSPVLLIMGFGVSGRAWTPQVNTLKNHHRVTWFDNRGVGDSSISENPYDFRDLAGDARKLMEHLGWRRAHIVGVSMGGMIAQEFALTYPSRVQSLSLIATLPCLTLKLSKAHRKYAPSAKGLYFFVRANQSRGDVRLDCLRKLLFSEQFLENHNGEENFSENSMESFAVPADGWTLWNQMKGILKCDHRDLLGTLGNIPTVILRPEGDLLVAPKNSDLLHELIPDSKLVSFPLAGHGLTQECAEAVNRVLLDHFASADETLGAAETRRLPIGHP